MFLESESELPHIGESLVETDKGPATAQTS